METKNYYFERINKLLKLQATAEAKIAESSKLRREANDLHWDLQDIKESSERHEVYLKSKDLYKKSEELSKLYNVVLSAVEETILKEASNAFIVDVKTNSEKWMKHPMHYKKFDTLVNDFFAPYQKVASNGNIYGFCIYCDTDYLSRLEIRNNTMLRYNHNEMQIIYRDAKEERLTPADIEKMQIFETLEACDILKTCKKAIKDAEKIEAIYADAKKKIDAIKGAYNLNHSIYYSLPSMDSRMSH